MTDLDKAAQKIKELNATATAIVEEIDAFDRDCADSEHTDTDRAWELLNRWRDNLKYVLES